MDSAGRYLGFCVSRANLARFSPWRSNHPLVAFCPANQFLSALYLIDKPRGQLIVRPIPRN